MNEQAIREVLEAIKKKSFVAGYVATDEEAMGLLLSKFFKWDGTAILLASANALEDANFHGESEIVRKMAFEE